MKTILAAALLISSAGCISLDDTPLKAEDCYPTIVFEGYVPGDIPEVEQYANLSEIADWEFSASMDCGETHWLLERGDGERFFHQRQSVDLEPTAVAFYSLNLLLQERGDLVVKQSIPLFVAEHRARDERYEFSAGTSNIEIPVPVDCCALGVYGSVIYTPATLGGSVDADWFRVVDDRGQQIAAGFDTIRVDDDEQPGWNESVAYGYWNFVVVREDPTSPFYGQEVEVSTGIPPRYVGIYEPGDVITP